MAQPIRVEGFHNGGYSFDEVTSSAESGSILGGLTGGGCAAFQAMRRLDAPALVSAAPEVQTGARIRPPVNDVDAWVRTPRSATPPPSR